MPVFERLLNLDLIELHSLQFGDDAEQPFLGLNVLMYTIGKISCTISRTQLPFCSSSIWLLLLILP